MSSDEESSPPSVSPQKKIEKALVNLLSCEDQELQETFAAMARDLNSERAFQRLSRLLDQRKPSKALSHRHDELAVLLKEKISPMIQDSWMLVPQHDKKKKKEFVEKLIKDAFKNEPLHQEDLNFLSTEIIRKMSHFKGNQKTHIARTTQSYLNGKSPSSPTKLTDEPLFVRSQEFIECLQNQEEFERHVSNIICDAKLKIPEESSMKQVIADEVKELFIKAGAQLGAVERILIEQQKQNQSASQEMIQQQNQSASHDIARPPDDL